MGLKRIKEHGGVAFVQDPREADFDEMPRNSIATGLVDDVLPVAEIPGKIARYEASLRQVSVALPAPRMADEQSSLREIFVQLRIRTGHDFSNYKRPTLLRRIERRIHVHGLSDIRSYAELIREQPDETQALFRDILISVTNFFRDEEPFCFIEKEIVPAILATKTAQDTVRVWVIGCATGEEAYSLAMLFAERIEQMIAPPKVQIFASDIDNAAFAVGREGLYTLNDAADITPERLRRYFTKENDQYRVRREIREMVLFASHNALKDPPFSHVDLVSCRNVLIYLDATAHERLLETIHFAINPGGYLFLGTSESIGEAADLFVSVGHQQQIFQSRAVNVRQYPVTEKIATFQTRMKRLSPASDQAPRNETTRGTFGDLHQQMLEQYAPPSVVVNEDYDIVHLSSNAGRYLLLGGGEPARNLLQLIRPELRPQLRTALFQATTRKMNIVARSLTVAVDNETEHLNIHVRPVIGPGDPARGYMLVLFEPAAGATLSDEREISPDEPVSQQLEEELIRLKQQLRDTNEAHEVQAEELKASNEELQAMNEELRSAAEELETSREELQSINEELTTVNQELNIKIEEVSQSGNNLRNLINSSDIATIFLDRSGRVHLFSPAAREIFNLLPADIGRPLSDITSRLVGADLLGDSARVLDTLDRVEREVATTDDRIYLMRLVPYRTGDDRIQGVVATFTNITERKRHEEEIAANLRDTQLLHDVGARLIGPADYKQALADIIGAAMTLGNADAGTVHMLDQRTNRLTLIAAVRVDDSLTEALRRIESGSPLPQALALASRQRVSVDFDAATESNRDGAILLHAQSGYRTGNATPLISRAGRMVGMLSTLWKLRHRADERELRFIDLLARQAADFVEQRQSSEALYASQLRVQAITDLVTDLLWSSDPDGSMNWYNRRWYEYTGQRADEALGYGWLKCIHPDEREATRQYFQEAITRGDPLQLEHRIRAVDGTYRWFLVHAWPLRGDDGKITQWFGSATDVEDIRSAHEALRQSEERLRLTFESVVDYAIFTMDLEGRIDSWNVGAQRVFGYEESEALGRPVDIIFTPEDRVAGAPDMERRIAREQGRAADERYHLRKDGSRFYVNGVMTLLRAGDVITGYAKVAHDLSVQKHASDALSEAHEKLEAKVRERTRELAEANVSLRAEIDERALTEADRQALLQQLVNAQEGERRRISRELHDQLGQQVSALSLKLSIMKRDTSLSVALKREIEFLEQLAKRIDDDLDFLVWELRPTALDDLGLVEALQDYIRTWSTHFGTPASFNADEAPGRLDPEMETVLYRIAQEALNNISKHASASQVTIALVREPQRVTFAIRDDGAGFDPSQPFGSGEKGLGLVSMRERASLAGGTVEIASKPGAGTTITVRLPLGDGGKRKTKVAGRKRMGK